MLHICRDFWSIGASSTVSSRFYGLYISALFLRGVLGFTLVGHTNFNIDSTSILLGSGGAAEINLGLNLERFVSLPTTYSVSRNDVGRIIALRSTVGRLNSGLYRIVGIDSNTNSVEVDRRQWIDTPPNEGDVSWIIFESEATVTAGFQSGANSSPSTQYHGSGVATTSRIILQSPHSSGWQVRIAAETNTDVNGTASKGIGAACSFAPGFAGNSDGDFPQTGQHLHPPLFYNQTMTGTSPNRVMGWLPGISTTTAVNPPRYYMWGDSVTGTCLIIVRSAGSTAVADSLVAFGIPEDEETLTSIDDIHRLFSFGSTDRAAGSIEMEAGPVAVDGQMGVAFGLSNQPITCVPSSYCYLSQNAIDSSIMHAASARDSSIALGTELYSWDLIAGTWDAVGEAAQSSKISLECRRLGRFPFARRGRENANLFMTSPSPNKTWLHTSAGIYVPWSGSISP